MAKGEGITVPGSGRVAAPEDTPALSLRERLIAYADLGKMEMFYPFLAVPLVWTLLPSEIANEGRTLVLLTLAVVFVVGVRTAERALDDVAGVRDGIDTFNYEQPSEHRRRSRKPLLDNRLTERDAFNYARFALATALAAFLAGCIIVEFDPLWAPLGALAAGLMVIGYSWGPKLSYIGAQELVAILGVTATVCVAYGFVTGELIWAAAVEGFVLGLWLDHTIMLANMHDLEGDRRAGRGTMAVLLPPKPYLRYVTAVFSLAWVVLLVAVILGELPWWLLLIQIPVVALQLKTLLLAVRDNEPLKGWRLARRAYPLGWATLVIANLFTFHW